MKKTKKEFIETFAHFMSEKDLNNAYDSHFPELASLGAVLIEEWLSDILENEIINDENSSFKKLEGNK